MTRVESVVATLESLVASGSSAPEREGGEGATDEEVRRAIVAVEEGDR